MKNKRNATIKRKANWDAIIPALVLIAPLAVYIVYKLGAEIIGSFPVIVKNVFPTEWSVAACFYVGVVCFYIGKVRGRKSINSNYTEFEDEEGDEEGQE